MGIVLVISLVNPWGARNFGARPSRESLPTLVIREERHREELLVQHPVAPGDRVAFHWIHSVEHVPWTDILEVQGDRSLLLVESRFGGFGAGISHDDPLIAVVDGEIITAPDRPPMERYSWINSHTALVMVSLNGEPVVAGDALPHHEALTLSIEAGGAGH